MSKATHRLGQVQAKIAKLKNELEALKSEEKELKIQIKSESSKKK